jgi:hypothetical protein
MCRRNLTRARAALVWGFVWFAAAQVVFTVVLDGWFPGVYDPEHDARLAALQARLAETPERPLLLLVGSSRTVMNFAPEVLPPLRTPSGQQVIPFNFSHLAAGPVMNLMEVHRVLRAGIRPAWVVCELMPPQLAEDRHNLTLEAASVADLPLLRQYHPASRLWSVFLRLRTHPWESHRLTVLRYAAPLLLTPEAVAFCDRIRLGPLGGDRTGYTPDYLDAAEIRRRTEQTRETYFQRLQNFHITAVSDRAVRDLAELCRREQIRLVFVMTPESRFFRSWYPAEALRRIDDYCAALGREYGVPVVDARTWLDDGDFTDAHHTLRRGAEAFTRRLGREVLQPLIEGVGSGRAEPTGAQRSQCGVKKAACRGV